MALLPSLKTRTLKFETPGHSHSGALVEIGDEHQATTYETNKPDFWDEEKTRPKMQRRFTLKTSDKDPSDPADDGERALYAIVNGKPGSLYHAINKALETATQLGGTLIVTYTGDDPESKNPRNPRKLYSASYTEPTPGQLLNGGTQAAATEPAQQATAATTTTAAAPQVPAGFTEAVWNGMSEDARNAVLALQ